MIRDILREKKIYLIGKFIFIVLINGLVLDSFMIYVNSMENCIKKYKKNCYNIIVKMYNFF